MTSDKTGLSPWEISPTCMEQQQVLSSTYTKHTSFRHPNNHVRLRREKYILKISLKFLKNESGHLERIITAFATRKGWCKIMWSIMQENSPVAVITTNKSRVVFRLRAAWLDSWSGGTYAFEQSLISGILTQFTQNGQNSECSRIKPPFLGLVFSYMT